MTWMVQIPLLIMAGLFLYGLFGGLYSPPEGGPPTRKSMHDPPDYDAMIEEFERELRGGRPREREEDSGPPKCFHYTEAGAEKVAWEGTQEYKLIQEAIRRR